MLVQFPGGDVQHVAAAHEHAAHLDIILTAAACGPFGCRRRSGLCVALRMGLLDQIHLPARGDAAAINGTGGRAAWPRRRRHPHWLGRSAVERSWPARSARRSSGTTSSSTAPQPPWSSRGLLPRASPRSPGRSPLSAPSSSGSPPGPVGAAIFGHYGDRIGRKAALIATLCLMGAATALMGVLPGYADHRHLGADPAGGAADAAGHRRGRRVGRLGAACRWSGGRTSGAASWPACRSSACRSACCCPRPCVRVDVAVDRARRTSRPGAGASRSSISVVLVGIGLYVRLGSWRPRVRQAAQGEGGRASSRCSRSSDPAAGDPASRVRPHGRAGAVLPVHHVRAGLRRRSSSSSTATTCSTTRWSPQPSA